jgi:hypothetical protein
MKGAGLRWKKVIEAKKSIGKANESTRNIWTYQK